VNGAADQPAAARREPSYGELVRQNRNFRMLWFGQIVSQLGDWFNAVAVYALVLDLTGSATAVALMMVVQQLPSSLVGPLAGVVIDRMDRRHVMVAADVVRGILVLGLLLVRNADQIWIAYLVIALAVSATAFFEPSRSAILPLVASRDELMPANALASATWSVMLAIGAAAGGAVTALAGRETAFLVNSASFFASAIFIARIRLGRDLAPPDGAAAAPEHGRGFVDGLRYLRAHRDVAAYVGIKGVWGLAGGVLLLLTILGERVFPLGGSTAAAIGVLYAARGVGAGVGSLLTGRLLGTSVPRLRRGIGPAFLTVALFYVALAGAPSLWMASLAVVGAHVGGSVLWVASAVLLQVTVPDHVRGRVFAIEFALLTLAVSVSSYATARVLDAFALGPRPLTLALGLFFLVPAAAWWVRGRRPTSSRASTA
jgi:predicted MFS family arabinose efflux permease